MGFGSNWRVKGTLDGNMMRFEMVSVDGWMHYEKVCECILVLPFANKCVYGKWSGGGQFNEEFLAQFASASKAKSNRSTHHMYEEPGTFEMNKL